MAPWWVPGNQRFSSETTPVHPLEQVLAFGLTTLYTAVMRIALQPQIGVLAIGLHGAANLEGMSDEAMQAGLCQIGNTTQTNSSDFPAVLLRRTRGFHFWSTV